MSTNKKDKLFSLAGNIARSAAEAAKKVTAETKAYVAESPRLQEALTKGTQTAQDIRSRAEEYGSEANEYALSHSVQLRRLAEIKAVHTEWEQAVARNDKKIWLYQQLLARELTENQRLIYELNEVLLKNYLAINNFFLVPLDHRRLLPVRPLQEQLPSPEIFSAPELAGAATVGMAAAGTAAFSGAVGLMTLLGSASTGTALSSLSGAAYWNAVLAAFGGGSLASGGLGMAGGTIVLGGLAAVPAFVSGYFITDHYTGKAYADAQNLKQDIISFKRSRQSYYALCEHYLALFRRLNGELTAFSLFFDSLLSISFAADGMEEREEYFAIFQKAALALLAYASVSPLNGSGQIDSGLEAGMQKAAKHFREVQEAFYDFRAKISPAYRKLFAELAEKSRRLEEQAQREADINALQEKLMEDRAALEKKVARLQAQQDELQSGTEEARQRCAELEQEKEALVKQHLYAEQQLQAEIDKQKSTIRKQESDLQKTKAKLEKQTDKAEKYQQLYAEVEKERDEAFLEKRDGCRAMYAKLEDLYWRFAREELTALASGEYLLEWNREQRLDFSAVAICYGKALEGIIADIIRRRSIPLPKEADADKLTLGSYIYFYKHFSAYFTRAFLHRLDKLNELRRDAAHKGRTITSRDIERMRQLLFSEALGDNDSLLLYLNDELGKTE